MLLPHLFFCFRSFNTRHVSIVLDLHSIRNIFYRSRRDAPVCANLLKQIQHGTITDAQCGSHHHDNDKEKKPIDKRHQHPFCTCFLRYMSRYWLFLQKVESYVNLLMPTYANPFFCGKRLHSLLLPEMVCFKLQGPFC